MATFNQGILGGFSGKTGSVIGSSWKGKSVMRSLPKLKKNRTLSGFQLDQQEKFKLMISFLTPFKELLTITYKKKAQAQSGLNAALSVNLRNAISGSSSPFGIDYSKLQFGYATGLLPNAGLPVAGAQPAGQIGFSWANNAGVSKAKNTDAVLILVYCPDLGQSIYFTDTATRSEELFVADASVFTGKLVQTWLLFISEDGTLVSPTAYTGPLTLIP